MSVDLNQAWRDRKLIYEGIKNYFRKQEFIEDIAKLRREQCNNCDYRSNKCSAGIKECCKLCGCDLDFKTRSLKSSCPDPDGSRWPAIID